MKYIRTLLFLVIAGVVSGQENTAKFYNGSEPFELSSQGGRYDLFVDFSQFIQALGRQIEVTENGLVVAINNRTLLLNIQKKVAIVNGRTLQVRLMLVNGKNFISVRSLINIVQPLLSRQLIYEPTSRVLLLAKERMVTVTMATGKDKQSYFLQIHFDKLAKKPTCIKSGNYLVIGFNTSFLEPDIKNLEFSDVIQNISVFDHLPDKTSELHVELGPAVTRHQVEPYTEDGGFIIIRFFGDFKDSAVASEEGADQGPKGIQRILLDPGHGGKDEGARGPTGLKEKHVTLMLCRALARSLEAYGYEVVLSREGDYHLPLKVRTGIANNEKVDLLVSLHMNAIKVPNAWGSETYYLSPDDEFTEEENFTVAFENQDLHEEDEPESGPESSGVDLDLILWDLAQTEFLEDSFRVAKYFQEELNILAGTKNRGIKQAPLKVLQGARMPACLVEVAFISNPSEEEKLKDPAFKSSIVNALCTAIRRYDRDVQMRNKGKNGEGDQP